MKSEQKKSSGFTLVEISIVMIIIGLLIGGTFGGMKLIENMQVNKTVQDLKSIESAALTFRDTYGRLPGDITSPSTRLPNCTVAPCATGGNGNRVISPIGYLPAITNADEGFSFWHHLSAADILQIGVNPSTDISFGEGQPNAPIDGGYRLGGGYTSSFSNPAAKRFQGTALFNAREPTLSLSSGNAAIIPCPMIRNIDLKVDDGMAYDGVLIGWGCAATTGGGWGDNLAPYYTSGLGSVVYDLKGF